MVGKWAMLRLTGAVKCSANMQHRTAASRPRPPISAWGAPSRRPLPAHR